MRAEATQFVVVPGHVDPSLEDTVVVDERYAVVRKRGAAAEVAEELDPRS